MRSTLYLFVVALMCSTGAYAQAVSGFGEVTGTVRDTQGEGIPDTTVEVVNDNLGVSRTMTTSDDGVFDAPALPPGRGYKLEVTRKNFEKWDAPEFEVILGRPINFSITLLMEKEAAPEGTPSAVSKLNDTTYDISATLDEHTLDGLPNPTRRVDMLALLTPAMTTDGTSGYIIVESERSTVPVRIDGSLVTNTFHLQAPPAPGLPQDSIEGVQVISAGVSPEFGSTMSGAIDIATRSGTNALHGSLYDYFNSHGWNASNKYGAGFRPVGRQHQGGASAAGHIQPDKEFFFVNLELVHNASEGINRITNPLIANLAGTTIPAANCTATAAQCATAIKFIQSQMNVRIPRTLYSLGGVGKIDYHLGDANTIHLEADARHLNAPDWANNAQVSSNGGLQGFNGNLGEEARHGKADWVSELGTHFVNDARVTWFHDRLAEHVDQGLLPSTGPLAISVAGTPIGGNPAYPRVLSEQRWQFGDQISLPINASALKIGVEYTRGTDALTQLYNRFGSYDYPSLTAFATDFSGNTTSKRSYTNFAQTLGNQASNLVTPSYGVYLQGSWKPMRRFTMAYGFWWDKSIFPQPVKGNATYFQTSSISSTNKDFAPRLGGAYLLNDRTIVRVGLGEYFQPFTGDAVTALNTQNGAYQNNIWLNPTQTGAPIFPRVLATSNTYPAGSQSVEFALSKWHNPHSLQGTVSIERQLGKDTTVTASYIYSRTSGLWTVSDQNLLPSTTLKTYLIDDARGNQVGTFTSLMYIQKSNASFAHAFQLDNEGSAQYGGAVLQVRKQMSHGLSAQASYTWSHARDDVSGPAVIGPGAISTYDGDYRADQGTSAFDQRHRVTGSWVWEPSLGDHADKIVRHLVNGWQVSGMTTMGSSLHQTATVILNGQQFSAINMVYTNSLNGSSGWNRVPFYPVNSLSTEPRYDVDARLARTFGIGERLRLTLLAEAFNVLNKQFNTSVNTLAFTSTPGLPPGLLNGQTSGVLRPVPGVGEGNAAGGYPFGTNARRAQVAFRFVF